jgi:putative transcriptional regulator
LDYANGTIDPASALIVASWLTLSPPARALLRECEALSGAMLETLCDPCAISDDALDHLLARIDQSAEHDNPCTTSPCTSCAIESRNPLPAPLARLFPAGKAPAWKKAFGGLRWIDLDIPYSDATVQMISAPPALAIPEHAHKGPELTLILEGALEDATGRYTRGDLIIMEDNTQHTPVADRDEGCLCFSVCANPIRFTGPFMRLINPLLRK